MVFVYAYLLQSCLLHLRLIGTTAPMTRPLNHGGLFSPTSNRAAHAFPLGSFERAAPAQDHSQNPTANALDQASNLAASVQPDAGASVAAAVPVQVPPVPQVMPLPVPVDALHASSEMPVIKQCGILGARARRFPKLHSQITVDDVTSYIALFPGCARCSETFRRCQIDGKALLRLCKHHLILRMKVGLAPDLKIAAAIDWLRRQEEKSAPSPK
ncbi:hypothetical protein MRX96_047750 [Rhipicephalus microplus]